MSDTPQPGTRTASFDSQIDDICVRFEDAWKAGQRPCLEQYLGELPAGGRAALLGELLKLDLHYRRRAGEQPTPDDYRPRFPDDLPLLQGVFTKSFAGPHGTADYGAGPGAAGAVLAGRYKLLQKVGEGGMGEVWVAEQTRPVRRQVALKLIKAGMDSKAVLSRFEAESQALSLMDHPNIAKLLDGGRAENGRPFSAMEFIKGVPITQYCDDARLSVRERVELFVPVCQAVQHAHQKGVIHRDLKPSNILVALYDSKPIPKVIDFGLAKAMYQPLTEHTLYTAAGAIMGTPLYMSPEQAKLNNLDIDTRTDIYSLGVVLYELLTGTTPLEKQRVRDGAWPEILQLIKEDEPPKPSTRLSGSATLSDIAARRKMEPARLSRLVSGELDWIAMKCLEKDRGRRYETANALALDLQRYLAGEPVLAAPPSAAYRLRKFVRKNRGPVVAAALVFLALTPASSARRSAWCGRRRRRPPKRRRRQCSPSSVRRSSRRAVRRVRTAGWGGT
jgi:serine/threonine protein kinase